MSVRSHYQLMSNNKMKIFHSSEIIQMVHSFNMYRYVQLKDDSDEWNCIWHQCFLSLICQISLPTTVEVCNLGIKVQNVCSLLRPGMEFQMRHTTIKENLVTKVEAAFVLQHISSCKFFKGQSIKNNHLSRVTGRSTNCYSINKLY